MLSNTSMLAMLPVHQEDSCWNGCVTKCLPFNIEHFFISTEIKFKNNRLKFILTNFYYLNNLCECSCFYKKLKQIKQSILDPKIILGDINVTRWDFNKIGATSSASEARSFNRILNNLELLEINANNR